MILKILWLLSFIFLSIMMTISKINDDLSGIIFNGIFILVFVLLRLEEKFDKQENKKQIKSFNEDDIEQNIEHWRKRKDKNILKD